MSRSIHNPKKHGTLICVVIVVIYTLIRVDQRIFRQIYPSKDSFRYCKMLSTLVMLTEPVWNL